MNAVPFDTLTMARKLQASGMASTVADGTVDALVDAMVSADLATKSDVAGVTMAIESLRGELKAEMASRHTDLKIEMTGRHTELRTEIATLNTQTEDGQRTSPAGHRYQDRQYDGDWGWDHACGDALSSHASVV